MSLLLDYTGEEEAEMKPPKGCFHLHLHITSHGRTHSLLVEAIQSLSPEIGFWPRSVPTKFAVPAEIFWICKGTLDFAQPRIEHGITHNHFSDQMGNYFQLK